MPNDVIRIKNASFYAYHGVASDEQPDAARHSDPGTAVRPYAFRPRRRLRAARDRRLGAREGRQRRSGRRRSRRALRPRPLRAARQARNPGQPLPLQRRLSVGGPGTLPGFDFGNASRKFTLFTSPLVPFESAPTKRGSVSFAPTFGPIFSANTPK